MNDYSLFSLDTFKNDILEELKIVKYDDLEGLVYRFQLFYDEILVKSDLKYIPTKRTGYSLNSGIYEVIVLNKTLKFILHGNLKVNVTNDDVRLEFNLKINQTLIFTEKSFFDTIFGFT